MLLNTRRTFYDELFVFLLRFSPQFRLILHLLDPDPHSERGSGSRKPIECGSGSETLALLTGICLSSSYFPVTSVDFHL
jgi:hypothetical protein